MTKNWIAVLTALLVAGACHAGGAVKDKDAPTTFATVGCTTPAVVAEPCPQTCCSGSKGHPCLAKAKAWLCFVPLRTCPCECKHCSSCHPPLYLYFPPCTEGNGCTHYDDHCSSCVANNCASCGSGQRLFHSDSGGGGACNSCK
jgi:hypothetical protein